MRLWSALLVTVLVSAPSLFAQGQVNPPEKLPKVLDGAIKPDAFYATDKNGSMILLPGMTFEEIDQLQKAKAGLLQLEKPYAFERVSIEGTADDVRADLNINFVIGIVSTTGSRIVIPLKMEGFHIHTPPDVVGVEEYGFDFDRKLGGHLLWVRAETPRRVEVRIRASSRASGDSGPGLELRLPTAPTSIELKVRGDNLDASVVGRGDEVVETAPGEAGQTVVSVESSGDEFTLNWRARDESRPTDQVLDLISRMRLNWDDPQTVPSVLADLEVSNRRGSVGPFEVTLPAGAELIEPLQNSTSALLTSRDPRGGKVQVSPIETEQLSRVRFTIEYRLPSGSYSAEQPLLLQPVEVTAAVRHSGELEVRTDRNFRLQWFQSPTVRSTRRSGANGEAPDPRFYLFQFDRADFELPVWLTAKRQPLRIEPQYTVSIDRSVATIEAKILVSGTMVEGLPLLVDVGDWQTTAIKDLGTGRDIQDPLSPDGKNLQLPLSELVQESGTATGFQWTAQRSVPVDSQVVEFPLPVLGSLDSRAVIISPGTLRVQTANSFTLITDVEASQGLSRISASSSTTSGTSESLAFRVQAVDAAPMYRGYLVESPPEAKLETVVDLTAGPGAQLRVNVQWTVTPRGSLRGQLPIRLPTLDDGEPNLERSLDPKWAITVNGQVAAVRPVEDTANILADTVIYSDQFNTDVCNVELTALYDFPSLFTEGEQRPRERRVQIALPTPAMLSSAEVEPAYFRVNEEAGLQLVVTHAGDETMGPSDLTQDSLIEAIIRPRQSNADRTAVIEQALLRSEIGQLRRFDRLVARVKEGAVLLVEFAPERKALLGSERPADPPIVKVFIDAEELTNFVQTANGLEIPLPGSEEALLVDVRVWASREGMSLSQSLAPIMRLPLSTGKTYWDLVLPPDRHVIWNAPVASQLMLWQYDRMVLHREPTRTYADLLTSLGASIPADSPGGNRYLLVTSDPASLSVYEAGRPLLWLLIAGSVLLASAVLIYLPHWRHPFVALVVAALLAGLAWMVPDLAIIAGQLVLLAMLLVGVMIGVRSILSRRPRPTVMGGIAEESSLRSASAGKPSATSEPGSARVVDVISSGSTAGARS